MASTFPAASGTSPRARSTMSNSSETKATFARKGTNSIRGPSAPFTLHTSNDRTIERHGHGKVWPATRPGPATNPSAAVPGVSVRSSLLSVLYDDDSPCEAPVPVL